MNSGALVALDARARIRDVLTAYFDALESRDWDRVASAFTPDATLDYGTPAARNVVDNIELLRAGVERFTSVSSLLGMHSAVTLDSDAALSETVAFTAHCPKPDGSTPSRARMSAVRYEDRWTRDSQGHWRICQRICHHEFKGWLTLD